MKSNRLFSVMILIALCCGAALPAMAANVTLRWNANTEADLAGYRIYYGTQPGTTVFQAPVSVGRITSHTLTNLQDNTTYCFRMTAVDNAGNESGYSSEVVRTTTANADTTLPAVTISAPTSGSSYTTGNATLALSGSASDNVGVTQVTWSNAAGGSGTASGTTSWSVASVSLALGSNAITVTARDAAGNTSTDTLTVTRTADSGGALVNLARGKAATQSSTAWNGVASRAVDGSTEGNYFLNSVSHTDNNAQAWWQVDLGSVGQIQIVNVWNRTDAVPERLSNFYVLVSDNPIASTNLSAARSQSGVSSYLVSGQAGRPTRVSVNRTGRYVRVQLAGTNCLHMAEVEVMGVAGAMNLARGKTVYQTSTDWGGVASRAVDGNTDGNFFSGSVSHTGYNSEAGWQVDLGVIAQIQTVNIWNRTDAVPERLTNFYVLVSDNPITTASLSIARSQSGVSSYLVSGQAGRPTTVSVNRTGRYVRVQLVGTNCLHMAEVEVMGQ